MVAASPPWALVVLFTGLAAHGWAWRCARNQRFCGIPCDGPCNGYDFTRAVQLPAVPVDTTTECQCSGACCCCPVARAPPAPDYTTALQQRWPLRTWRPFQARMTPEAVEGNLSFWWEGEMREDTNWAVQEEGAHCTWGRKPKEDGSGEDQSIQLHAKLSRPDGTLFDAGSRLRPQWPVPPEPPSPLPPLQSPAAPAGQDRSPAPSVWDRATVFIGVASYRDAKRCGHTLLEAFLKAYNPNRVHVGVVDQRDNRTESSCVQFYCELMLRQRPVEAPWDLGGLDKLQARLPVHRPGQAAVCPHRDRIVVRDVPYRDAKGPVYARYLQQQLIGRHSVDGGGSGSGSGAGGDRTQTFCMQIDAHSILREWWDRAAIAQWLQTDNENAVLSHYPWNISEYEDTLFSSQVPHLCMSDWGYADETEFVRNWDAEFCNGLSRPKLNTLLGAGFVFSKCHADLAVPNDPLWRQVFYAEEFGRAARLFTHGYDLYTPARNIVWHDYRPSEVHGGSKPWIHENDAVASADEARMEVVESEKRVAHLRIKTLFHLELMAADVNPKRRQEFLQAQGRAEEEAAAAAGVVDGGRSGCVGGRCPPPPPSPSYSVDPAWEAAFEPDLGTFGFGDRRTFAQLLAFTGIKPREHARSDGQQCGDLQWVPFKGAREVTPAAAKQASSNEYGQEHAPGRGRGGAVMLPTRLPEDALADVRKRPLQVGACFEVRGGAAECCQAADTRPDFRSTCVPVTGAWDHTCEPLSYMLGLLQRRRGMQQPWALAMCDQVARGRSPATGSIQALASEGSAFGRRQGEHALLVDGE